MVQSSHLVPLKEAVLGQCCCKMPDEADVDAIYQSIFEEDLRTDPDLREAFDDLRDEVPGFPVPEDFGCDEYSCHFDPGTGHNHYTAYSESNPYRVSWDTDNGGNYIEGTVHATYIGTDGNKHH